MRLEYFKLYLQFFKLKQFYKPDDYRSLKLIPAARDFFTENSIPCDVRQCMWMDLKRWSDSYRILHIPAGPDNMLKSITWATLKQSLRFFQKQSGIHLKSITYEKNYYILEFENCAISSKILEKYPHFENYRRCCI